jgi:hypothetical protein
VAQRDIDGVQARGLLGCRDEGGAGRPDERGQVEVELAGQLQRRDTVVRERLDGIAGAAGGVALEPAGGVLVPHEAGRAGLAAVGQVADQRMGERERGLVGEGGLDLRADELAARQLGEDPVHLGAGQVGDGGHGAGPERRTDHRGGLERAPGPHVEQVDPARDDRVNRVGQGDLGVVGEGDTAAVGEHADVLVRVERGAPGQFGEPVEGGPAEHQPAEQVTEEAAGVLVGERVEPDGGEVRHVAGPRRERLDGVGTEGGDDHQRYVGPVGDEARDESQQHRVAPVQVLEDQDGGAAAGEPVEEQLPGRLGLLGTDLRSGIPEEWRERLDHARQLGGVEQLREGASDLVPRGDRVVGLGDARHATHDVGECGVRAGLARWQAAAAVPVDRACAGRLAGAYQFA